MNNNRPLFTLTVEEYIAINEEIFNKKQNQIIEIKNPDYGEIDTIYIQEVTKITGYTEKTVYTKVCRKEMPSLTSGKPLTFSRKQINNWIEKGRPSVAEMQASDFLSKQKNKKN